MANVVDNYGTPPWDELQKQESFKYAKLDFALTNSTPWCQELIMCMYSMLPGIHLYTVVDIKVWQNLKKGNYPARPLWHYDCVKDKTDPAPEEYHALYQYGAGCFTQFEDTSIKDGDIVIYGRELHAATPALLGGKRLLVRVSQCDTIQGGYTSYTPMNIGQIVNGRQ